MPAMQVPMRMPQSHFSGRICGKSSTSWIAGLSVSGITKGPMPKPDPANAMRSTCNVVRCGENEPVAYFGYMTLEQRKIELVRWITTLKDHARPDRMDDLRKAGSADVPDALLRLLELSPKAAPGTLVKHSSAKELLKRK